MSAARTPVRFNRGGPAASALIPLKLRLILGLVGAASVAAVAEGWM
jgi:hypothetical protein